jgi:hypothetical protein
MMSRHTIVPIGEEQWIEKKEKRPYSLRREIHDLTDNEDRVVWGEINGLASRLNLANHEDDGPEWPDKFPRSLMGKVLTSLKEIATKPEYWTLKSTGARMDYRWKMVLEEHKAIMLYRLSRVGRAAELNRTAGRGRDGRSGLV